VPLIYLDSAATSQKPTVVINKLVDYYTQINSNVHRGAHYLSREATTSYEQARDKVASFIHANRNEIIFTSGATESINLVAQSYGRNFLSEGDEIVLTVAEHHANLVPWQILAKEKNLTLKFVRINKETGSLDLQHMESLLSSKTKLVGFQHVSNVLGVINPVKTMVSMIREQAPEAKILLDACQSVPHMPVNVQELGVDFLAASGHKMCGPTGIGFLWGHEDLLNSMPPWKGGGEMIDQVTLEGSTWQPSPGRFEAGTPAIAQAIGLGVAIDYLTSIGMEDIEAYEHELAQYLFDRIKAVPGITILGPQNGKDRVALCAFIHESIHPSDLSTFLDMEGVAVRAGHHCCQPLHQEFGYSHSARASLYLYNTKE
jgi:cysteine desulfurase/selenocysteine lyase